MNEAPFGFDAAFLQRLERLSVRNRLTLPGQSAGPRRSPRHGSSVEFMDFRDYSPGDDFRRIDWNAYARLSRLFLRLYRAEEMTTVTIFLDRSRSMSFGNPSKALSAARLSAILAFVALHNYDRVAVAGWGDRIDPYLPPRSGKGAVRRVWSTIGEALAPVEGATDFAALAQHRRYRTGPGLAVVLSDLMTESDWRRGLRALRSAAQEVTVIQILAPEELKPELRGDWRLRDAETGATRDVTVSPRLLRRYEEELAAHTAEVTQFCRQSGIAFVRVVSNDRLMETVLADLRGAGVLE